MEYLTCIAALLAALVMFSLRRMRTNARDEARIFRRYIRDLASRGQR